MIPSLMDSAFLSHKEGCAGIEEYGIAFRTPYPAAKDIARNPGIFFRRPAKEVFLRAGTRPKSSGRMREER